MGVALENFGLMWDFPERDGLCVRERRALPDDQVKRWVEYARSRQRPSLSLGDFVAEA